MDERIGIIGGNPPQRTLGGHPLPDKPYPVTVRLDETHYVVMDMHTAEEEEAVIAELREKLKHPIQYDDLGDDDEPV